MRGRIAIGGGTVSRRRGGEPIAGGRSGGTITIRRSTVAIWGEPIAIGGTIAWGGSIGGGGVQLLHEGAVERGEEGVGLYSRSRHIW